MAATPKTATALMQTRSGTINCQKLTKIIRLFYAFLLSITAHGFAGPLITKVSRLYLCCTSTMGLLEESGGFVREQSLALSRI